MKGLPSRPLQNAGFRAPRVSLPNRQNTKKEGGVKLLDINEQPIGYSQAKKRKRQQDIEDAKKAAEDVGAAGVGGGGGVGAPGGQVNPASAAHVKSENIAPQQNTPTPDYAANLAGASIINQNVVPPPAYVPPTPQAPQQAPAPPPPPAYAPVQQTAVTLPLAAAHQTALPGNPVTVALPTVPHPGVSAGTRIVQLPTQPIPQVFYFPFMKEQRVANIIAL